MPGVDPAVVEAMVAQVAAAGGGLTGVFEVSADAVDPEMTTEVDSRDRRAHDAARRLPDRPGGRDVHAPGPAARRRGRHPGQGRAAVQHLLRHDQDQPGRGRAAHRRPGGPVGAARPGAPSRGRGRRRTTQDADDTDDALAATAIYTGLTTGSRDNAAGVVVLGDTASGDDGLLADLRADPLVTSTLATVDGGDTVIGQVTAMLAVISALDGSVGAYGASGSDGAVPST